MTTPPTHRPIVAAYVQHLEQLVAQQQEALDAAAGWQTERDGLRRKLRETERLLADATSDVPPEDRTRAKATAAFDALDRLVDIRPHHIEKARQTVLGVTR